MKNILKWIGVLPIAIISFIFSNFIWRLLSLKYFEYDNWLDIIFVEVFSAVISSASFIYSGLWLAPKYKNETALVLSIILILLYIASFFVTNFLTYNYFTNISLISGSVSVILCYLEVKKNRNEIG